MVDGEEPHEVDPSTAPEYEMSEGVRKLEAQSSAGDLDVDRLVKEYELLYVDRPLWRLAEDIQQQALVYWNMIERLKAGETPEDIRSRFVGLRLAPTDVPNPDAHKLLQRAFDKLSRYRSALVTIIRRYGGRLLEEMSIEVGATVGLAANIGFPPSISISIEHTYHAVQERRWTIANSESPASP